MEETYLIYFAMILLLGTLVSALATKLRISNVFFLVFTGMVLGSFGLINFPNKTIIIISTLSMIIVVFDSTVKLKFRDIEKFSSYSMKLVLIFFLLNLGFLSAATYFMFDLTSEKYLSFVLAFTFACLMYGIDHFLTLDGISKSKVIKVLEIESLLNRPLTLIAPLILLNYMSNIYTHTELGGFAEIYLFLNHVITGTVIGVLGGIFVIVILNSIKQEELSYLVVLTSCVVIYVVAESVKSNGVISLTIFSLLFGNYHIKHKHALEKFTSIFGYVFNLFMFILIGTVMLVKFEYLLKGTVLFLFYILIRSVSVFLALYNSGFSTREKIFMSLNIPKGIDVAIIILILMVRYSHFEGISTIIDLSLLFSLYSIVLSNILTLFIPSFMSKNVIKKQRNKS